MREEFYGFGNALGASIRNINEITMVVFDGSAEIPALNVMRRPGATSGGGIKYEHLGARRCEWRFVKIKSTVELGLGKKSRVDEKGTEQV